MAQLPNDFRILLEQETRLLGGPQFGSGAAAEPRRSRVAMARLERLYGYALRHTAPERDRVLREVARQVLRHGPAYVLGRSSRQARLFMSWGQGVYREVYAARRQIRFSEGHRRHELVAFWRFRFPVVDLVLRHFHRRLREHTLILVDGSRAYIHDGCGIRLERAGRVGGQARAPWSIAIGTHESPLPTPAFPGARARPARGAHPTGRAGAGASASFSRQPGFLRAGAGAGP